MAPASLTVMQELTAAQLLAAVDDTNEAPWMTMPEFQFRLIQLLLGILELHARRNGLGWHVSGELGVRMPKPEGQGTLTLGPDLFMVEADQGLRTSWDTVQEGQPPRFVLEVVTQDSASRDTDPEQKVGYYAAMGVEEYAIYWPYRPGDGPTLFGHRRDADGAWVDWRTDEHGVLWSEALSGLGLIVTETPWLRVVTPEGDLLPSLAEEADARWLAEARAAHQAMLAAREAARAEQEASARRAAEAEVARLRALLKELQN